jgi:Na+/H+ antiporter NhaD/arsenite permease-like protein
LHVIYIGKIEICHSFAFQGIDFTKYMLHMSTGVAFIMIATNLQLRYIYRDIHDLKIQEPHDVTGNYYNVQQFDEN